MCAAEEHSLTSQVPHSHRAANGSPSLDGKFQPIMGLGMEAGCPGREAAHSVSALQLQDTGRLECVRTHGLVSYTPLLCSSFYCFSCKLYAKQARWEAHSFLQGALERHAQTSYLSPDFPSSLETQKFHPLSQHGQHSNTKGCLGIPRKDSQSATKPACNIQKTCW